MRVDLNSIILDLDGEPLLTPRKNATVATDTEPLTLARACATALMAPTKESEAQGWEQKADTFALALRLNAGGEQEITEAEATVIKTAIARAYPSPLIVGRAAALLRGIPGKLEGVKAA